MFAIFFSPISAHISTNDDDDFVDRQQASSRENKLFHRLILLLGAEFHFVAVEVFQDENAYSCSLSWFFLLSLCYVCAMAQWHEQNFNRIKAEKAGRTKKL